MYVRIKSSGVREIKYERRKSSYLVEAKVPACLLNFKKCLCLGHRRYRTQGPQKRGACQKLCYQLVRNGLIGGGER